MKAHSDTQLVVVDNGSHWPQPHGDITLTVTPNLGFSRGCNIGASAATGDILVFLNNDTEVHEGWLDALLRPFEDEAIGITGARLTYPDGSLQHAGVTLDFIDGILTAHNVLTEEPSGLVAAVTGACLAIRAPLFRNLGGFDHGFYNGYEDVDLCLKARCAQFAVYYCADSHVTHHESASGESRWYGVQSNIARLHNRWADTLAAHG